MVEENILDYLFEWKNQCWSHEDIEVDPQLLSQCIITDSNSTVEDIEQLFQYELCAYPASLFDSSGLMRETDNPWLTNNI